MKRRAITDFFSSQSKRPAAPKRLCSDFNKEKWASSLSAEQRDLLDLELRTLDISWLAALHEELTKPYFLNLKKFIQSQKAQIFPPPEDIYSWSRLCPLDKVRVVILGQDPYHNYGQAHGLAFSVRPPTPTPPSLQNIYKELASCVPGFQIPRTGLLIPWAEQGVLLLNACLTVEAHKANSHANHGWEIFTEQVLRTVLKTNPHVCLLAWGTPAAKRVDKLKPGQNHCVFKCVHPSPLSASRGWFGSAHFKKANEWLKSQGLEEVDWNLVKHTEKPSTKPAEKSRKPTQESKKPSEMNSGQASPPKTLEGQVSNEAKPMGSSRELSVNDDDISLFDDTPDTSQEAESTLSEKEK